MIKLNDAEREKRKNIWDSIPQSEKERLLREKEDIIRKYIQLEAQAVEELQQEGKWMGGLDGDYPELKTLSAQYKKELEDLINRALAKYQ